MARVEMPRLAILGAGPMGLEAAIYAQKLHIPFTLFERGRIAEYVRRWGHVRLFSPFGMNTTSLGKAVAKSQKPLEDLPLDDTIQTGTEYTEIYLSALANAVKDHLKTENQVLRIGRKSFLKSEQPGDPARAKQPFLLLVREKNQERMEEADVVLDCTGTFGQHRWIGDGGIPALGEIQAEPYVSYGLDDVLGDRKKDYLGKTIMVVGSGYSAANSVSNLAKLAAENNATWTIWLARSPHSTPLKRFANDTLKERDRLAVRANNLATRSDDNVEFHAGYIVEAVEFLGQDKGFRITARQNGKKRTWDVDKVIGNVGYTPDTLLYRELQIHECYASLGPMKMAASLFAQTGLDCTTQKIPPADALRNPEPNFFILGAKSYGRNSQFLLRIGHEQIRQAFQWITGKPDLDLYKNS